MPPSQSWQNWQGVEAPTLGAFEALARHAFQQLPGEFRRLAGDILFRIEDFPSDDVLDDLGIESEFGLLGLYQGVSLRHKDSQSVPQGPDVVILYRRPILDQWAEGGETLDHVIRHVLVHEIGHHFGLSDADMEAIEADDMQP